MAAQIVNSPSRTCSSLRQAFSFSSIKVLIDRPVSLQSSSSCSPLSNGNGSSTGDSVITGSSVSLSLTTKPPPSE